jgi:hypothetical protein
VRCAKGNFLVGGIDGSDSLIYDVFSAVLAFLLCFCPVVSWAVEIVAGPKPISSPVVAGILTVSQAVWCGLNPTLPPPWR